MMDDINSWEKIRGAIREKVHHPAIRKYVNDIIDEYLSSNNANITVAISS